MVVYNFKKITCVPDGKELIEIVLGTTQRKTPTVVHKHYQITRIRGFYMRKVKFAQQTFHDRISKILEDFPILEDLHPFYADLLNVLYDKDHYKLALAQLNTARKLIDNVALEHVRFLKFGDSLYRCKQLKRAALGRMCTIVKNQHSSLAYLEQVRQHLARLPSIDPSTRTIICTGYPNVGKSSMMNRLTRAQVDVQPYAFTTKSLFVGHMDYSYLRWQVIDTPGILDHPLEERNTIEMQAITALAHLRAAVLFVLDISAQCGWSISEQIKLFESIKPLFAGKPLVIALNKIDVIKPENLSESDKELLKGLERQGIQLAPMSTLTEEGVSEVKKKVCDMLLAQRTEQKLQSKKAESILNRLHVAQPKPRDMNQRPSAIPESVVKAQEEKYQRDLDEERAREMLHQQEKELPEWKKKELEMERRRETRAQEELEQERIDLEKLTMGENPWADYMKDRETYVIDREEWRYDVIPEIIEGQNIADYVDPEIDDRLDELDREEELLVEEELREKAAQPAPPTGPEEDERQDLLRKIRKERRMLKVKSQSKKRGEAKRISGRATKRTEADLEEHLEGLGINPELAGKAAEEIGKRESRKRTRSMSRVKLMPTEEDMSAGSDEEGGEKPAKKAKMPTGLAMARAHVRSSSIAVKERAIPTVEGKQKAAKMMRHDRKQLVKSSRIPRVNESDRRILAQKPKHLYSGKTGFQRDRR